MKFSRFNAYYFFKGGISLFFYSDEGGEPAHVHGEEGNKSAKFWLAKAELARAGNFKGYELASIRKLVIAYKDELMEAWNVHFTRTK